jgi:hypothetical protein
MMERGVVENAWQITTGGGGSLNLMYLRLGERRLNLSG